MPEIYLRQPAALGKTIFTYNASETFTKKDKEYKYPKKQEIHDIFLKAN